MKAEQSGAFSTILAFAHKSLQLACVSRAIPCLVAQLCPTLCDPARNGIWTIAHQAPLSMGFSREEYRGGLLCPPPGDLPDPGIRPRSPTLQVDSLSSESPGKPCVSQPHFIVTLEENSHPGLLEGREGVRAVAKRLADQKSGSQ